MRTPALPELAAARAELAQRPGAISQFNVGGEIDAAAAEEARKAAAPESFKRFEAMVLQTFIQNMLPQDGAAVYGKGMAGEMWKSLLAEKMAGAMAERGGIGIADRMLGGERYAKTAEAKNSAPPTEIGEIAKTGGAAETGSRFDVAPVVLDGMQRTLSELLGDGPTSPETSVQSTTKRG